ncbi:MAG: hypothetical protein Q9183_001669, partial [Haloplaca sp. 2 TL-2023]
MVTDIAEYTVSDGEVETKHQNDLETLISFTLTGPTTYTTTYTRAFHPGRPWQAYYPPNYQCCMNCYIYFPNVDVYYWPVPEEEEICANGTEPLRTAQVEQLTSAAKTAEAKFNALVRNNSITGPVSTVNDQGFTFVSPSVYVAFHDVSAGDACGDIGQEHTSITLGFAPGELQTVTALGKDHYDTTLGTRPFDPRNVLCPPDFEVEELFLKQDRLAGISTYRPRVQIPPALQNLDPAWKDCVVGDYEGIDPPHPLVPASGFGDVPGIVTDEPPVQEATPAASIPELPKPTGDGMGGDPSNDPLSEAPGQATPVQVNPVNANPVNANPVNANPVNANPVNADPVNADPVNANPVNADPVNANPVNADPVTENPQDSSLGSATAENPSFAAPKLPPAQGPSGDAAPKPNDPAGSNGQPGGTSNGQAADGPAKDPIVVPDPTKATQDQGRPAAIVPEVAQPRPAQPAVVIQDQIVKQGDDPVTIDDKPVVYSHGSVIVGGVAAPAPTTGQIPVPQSQPKADAKPDPIDFEGFEFTPVVQQSTKANAGAAAAAAKPAILVEGQTIHQDTPATSINGHEVLYSGNTVRIDGNPIRVLPSHSHLSPEPVTANGLAFTPSPAPPTFPNTNNERPQNQNQDQGQSLEPVNGPSGHPVVVVKGQSITENGAPATINGRPIVYSGGAVYVAGTRAAIPTVPASRPEAQAVVSAAGLKFTPLPRPPPTSGQAGGNAVPAIVVAGHTLTQDAPAIVVDGATLAYSQGSVFVNGKAAAIPTAPAYQPVDKGNGDQPIVVNGLTISAIPQPPTTTSVAVITTLPNGQSVSRNPSGDIIIEDATLSPERPAITISGTAFSLSNDQVIINGMSTIPLPPSSTSPAASGSITPGPPLTIFGSTITPIAAGAYVVAGATISPNGPAVTVSGISVSLDLVGTGEGIVMAVGSSMRTLEVASNSIGLYNSTTFSTGAASSTGGVGVGPTGDAGAGAGEVAPFEESAASRWGL